MDFLLGEEGNKSESCDRYYTGTNKTHFIYGGYEGIPENLLINFIVWLVSDDKNVHYKLSHNMTCEWLYILHMFHEGATATPVLVNTASHIPLARILLNFGTELPLDNTQVLREMG